MSFILATHSFIKNSIISPNFLSSLIKVLSSNVINNLVAALITLFMARSLGASEFGSLALSLAIVNLVSLTCDSGLNIALNKYLQKPLELISIASETIITTAIKAKVIIFITLVILSLVLNTWIIKHFIPLFQNHINLLPLTVIAGGLLSLWSTFRAIEQAKYRYLTISLHTFAYALLRLLSFLVLFLLDFLYTAESALIILYILPISLLALISFSFDVVNTKQRLKSICRKVLNIHILFTLYKYGFWITISSLSFILLSTLPQFILNLRASSAEVGIYSAPLIFLGIFSLFNDSIRTITLPIVNSLSNLRQRYIFRRKIRGFFFKYIGLGLIILSIISFLYYYLLDSKYKSSLPILIVLGLSMIIVTYIGFFNLLWHSHGKPQYDTLVNISRLVSLICLLNIIPPTPIYFAISLAIIQISGEILLYFMVKRLEVLESENTVHMT